MVFGELSLAGWISITIVALLLAYYYIFRHIASVWGAWKSEINRYLPGDELVPWPRLVTTRAITIKSPAAEVWPWLVQIGQDKGGFYSYQWIENLIGIEIHNANQIIPDFQHLKIGDAVKFNADGGLRVVAMDPGKVLVLSGFTYRKGVHPPQDPEINVSWVFYLEPIDKDSTRLIVRFKMVWRLGFMNFVAYRLLLEPCHFIMERKMLTGIRKRVEKLQTVF